MGKSTAEKAKSGLQDVFIYIGIFFVFYLLLKQMLRYAKKTIDKIRPLPKIDDFIKRNGYTFDFAIVFSVYDETDVFTPDQAKHSMRNIIDRIVNAGLETRCFYSCQRDEIYVKVRAEPERLRAEASRINYRLQLDPEKLRAKAHAGKKRQGEWIWKSIEIGDEFKVSRYNPYHYIYASYDANAYADGLYKLYPALENHKHVFTGLNRIELIISIMAASASLTPPGAGLNLDLLKADRQILASFPLHDYDQLNALQLRWLNLFSPPWKQPTDEIKDYFGHRIALYFLYLGHYVELLMLPALLGAITFIVQKVYYYPENFLMPWFAGFMVLWSTVYIELWKRKQSTAAMRWGSSGCEDEEQDRAVYKGDRIKSPVNGQMITYFPPEDKANRSSRALTAVVTMIAGVISIVIGIYIFQFWINLPSNRDILHIGAVNLTSVIASLLNTVVVVVLNILYQKVAIRLNDYENHRTDTEYEDNLIAKIFSFQLVNTFAGLTYVSFVKRYINIICTKDNCTGEVAGSLSTVFLTAMVTRALIQIFIRKFNQSRKEKQETSGLPPGVKPSSLEEQYILDEYPIIIGTLADYAGLTIQFGYTVLFVAAFPLAPTIALVSGYIQIRIDGWKLCQAFQRPRPKTAEDIGMWQDMIEILGVIGVVYNFGLVFLTGHYLNNLTWQYRWIVFILVEHVTFLMKYILSIVIDDVPSDVQMQLDRQEYLVSKVIRNEADELEEEFVEKKSNMSFGITDYDDDYLVEGEDEPSSSAATSSAALSPASPLMTPSPETPEETKDVASADRV